MKINLKLLDSNSAIASKILKALVPQINLLFNKSIKNIKSEIILALSNALKSEPEYSQLVSGMLKADLGISNSSVVDSIVEELANTTNVTLMPVSVFGNSMKGGILIEAIRSDNISNIIYSDSAYVVDAKGYSMPWLEWLLLMGNSVLVKGYDVRYGPNPNSRSGNGIMVKSNGDWRVPPEYQGTAGDNWTTRAIDRLENQITNIISNNIKKNL